LAVLIEDLVISSARPKEDMNKRTLIICENQPQTNRFNFYLCKVWPSLSFFVVYPQTLHKNQLHNLPDLADVTFETM
jgi:hypothetical protein